MRVGRMDARSNRLTESWFDWDPAGVCGRAPQAWKMTPNVSTDDIDAT